MSDTPSPLKSPGHPIPADGDSHEVKLSEHEYKKRMAAWEAKQLDEKTQQALLDAEERGRAKADAFARRVWVIGGSVIGIILATVGTLAWGQAKIDGGIKPVKEELAEHKKEEADKHAAIERHFERQDEKFDRMDQKLELILDAERVPKWKRPVEPPKVSGWSKTLPDAKDGGQ